METAKSEVFERETLALLPALLQKMGEGFNGLPDHEAGNAYEPMRMVLEDIAGRLHDNYPYHHPLYAGQMLKPPHPVARLAYSLAMWLNPNNHALDGGRASSAMEKDAVAQLAGMFGLDDHLGHLCGGGTMANMEALWVARTLHPGKMVVASGQAHYTHSRISEVLGIPFRTVPVDERGRMDVAELEQLIQAGGVGTIVATMGTTGSGAVDPLPEILTLAEHYGLRVHADAAYGGYFTLASALDKEARAAFDTLSRVDSIVVDPHKHGLQPYGCGCILFRDPAVGRIYKHDSPYTYFSSDELHLGEISLECSRPGAAAVALYATMELLPLVKAGEFAEGLDRSLKAARVLYTKLEQDSRYRTLFRPELDIVLWAPTGGTGSEISGLSRRLFDRAAEHDLHLALVDLPIEMLTPYWDDVDFDQPTVTCLRSCLMKPEHLDWIERIWDILDRIR